MSSIVLSASVRQNLLSLQSTASLLATTQNDLATGDKVNSALDNPTSFFTASSLNDRASDISNLLDSIGNGVQVLQAANTGITSLQSLVASAQSIANQVLQTPIGYSAKSSVVATAITGATANNLLGTASGTGPAKNAVATGTGAAPTVDLTGLTNAQLTGTTSLTAGLDFTAPIAATTASATGTLALANGLDLSATAPTNATITGSAGPTGGVASATITINGTAVTLPAAGSGSGTGGNFTAVDIATAINNTNGLDGIASVDGSGNLVLTSNGTAGATDTLVTTGLTQFGIADQTATGAAHAGVSFDVNGKTVNFAGGQTYTQQQVEDTINAVTGPDITASFNTDNQLVLTSATAGASGNFSLSGAGLSSLGLTATIATTNGADQQANPGLSFTVNGTAVTLAGGKTYSAQDVASAINKDVTGVNATVDKTGDLVITSTSATKGTTDKVTVGGTGAAALGFTTANLTASGQANTTSDLTFQVNDQTVTLKGGASYDADDIAAAINNQVGTSANVKATVDATSGDLVLTSTGTAGASDQIKVDNFSSGDATQLGFASAIENDNGSAPTESIAGQTLTIAATGGGTATNITFGTGANQISTLNGLNAALSANNLQATIDSTGALTITTTNNAASSTIGAIGGSATETGGAFAGLIAGEPVEDPNSQATRTGLVSQYNNILAQIDTTSQDSSFNGVNLLQGDTLNLTFDETGKSTLAIKGVTFNTAGLGLSQLNAGTAFLDSNSANAVLSSLTQVSSTLRSEASNLGSNLSIVQIRQDFSESMINVLQTGASNLTLADTNEEAANSQALSTRQSIAVSALALANQSQQSVLQLLR